MPRPGSLWVFLENQFAMIFACLLSCQLVSYQHRYFDIVDMMRWHNAVIVSQLKRDYFVFWATDTTLGEMTHYLRRRILRRVVLHIDIVGPWICNCWAHSDTRYKIFTNNEYWSSNLKISFLWICKPSHLQVIGKGKSEIPKFGHCYCFPSFEILRNILAENPPYLFWQLLINFCCWIDKRWISIWQILGIVRLVKVSHYISLLN